MWDLVCELMWDLVLYLVWDSSIQVGLLGLKWEIFISDLRSVNNKNILLIKIIYNFQVLLELNTLIRSQIWKTTMIKFQLNCIRLETASRSRSRCTQRKSECYETKQNLRISRKSEFYKTEQNLQWSQVDLLSFSFLLLYYPLY